jgi:hypothetical protein
MSRIAVIQRPPVFLNRAETLEGARSYFAMPTSG